MSLRSPSCDLRPFYAVLVAHTVASYAAIAIEIALTTHHAPYGIAPHPFDSFRIDFSRDPGGVLVESIVGPPILEPVMFLQGAIGPDSFWGSGKIDREALANVVTYPIVGVGSYFLLRSLHRKRIAPGK